MKSTIGLFVLIFGLVFLAGVTGCNEGRTVVVPGAAPAPILVPVPGPVTHEKTIIVQPNPATPPPPAVIRETVLVVPAKEKPAAPPPAPVEIKVDLNLPGSTKSGN